MFKNMITLTCVCFLLVGCSCTDTSQNTDFPFYTSLKINAQTKDGDKQQTTAAKPAEQLLWKGAPPFANGTEKKDLPRYQVYSPDEAKNTGAAIVVFPGGGYGHLAMGHEGHDIGVFLNKHGVTAIVVQYRLGPKYHHPTQITDAQRAIRTVRHNAVKWKIDPKRIGVMGFSAGGHLASTTITHFDGGDPDAEDPIDRLSSRPDFGILCYPVIAINTPYGHTGSKRNLLGNDPAPELVNSLANQTQIKKDTPPTFLFHTNADRGVPPENSILFYMGLRKHGIPAELHIYEQGRHGVGLAAKDPVLHSWSTRLIDWLKVRKIIQ